MPKTVDRLYRYTDRDIRSVLVAKGADSSAETKHSFFRFPYQDPAKHESSQIIATIAADGVTQDGFLKNEKGGVNLRMEAMALTGEEYELGHKYYMPAVLQDLLHLEQVSENEGFLPFSPDQIYPAQILFPLNLGNYHWIAAQIMVDKGDDGKYSLTFAQYDPTRLYPDEISQDIIDKFCEQFQHIFGLDDEQLEVADPDKGNAIGKKIVGADGKVRTERMQKGGLACGVYTAEALYDLQTKNPQEMWDDFGEDDVDASRKRLEHINLVVGSAAIAQEERNSFISYRHNRLAARASVRVKKDDFVKEAQDFIKKAIAGDVSKHELFIKINEVNNHNIANNSNLWPDIFNEEVLKCLGEELVAEDYASRETHEAILEILSYKISANERQKMLGDFIDRHPDLGAAIVQQVVTIRGDLGFDEEDEEAAKEALKAGGLDKMKENFDGAIEDDEIESAFLLIDQNRADKEFLSYALEVVVNKIKDSEEYEPQLIRLVYELLKNGAVVSKEAKDNVLEVNEGFEDEAGLGINEDIDALKYIIENEYLFNLASKGNDIVEFREELESYKRRDAKGEYYSAQKGEFLLHAALENDDSQFFVAALEGLPRQIDSISGIGDSVLQKAVFLQKSEAVQTLLDKGASLEPFDGQKISELAQAAGLAQALIDRILGEEQLLEESLMKSDEIVTKAQENLDKIEAFIDSILSDDVGLQEAKQALRDRGIINRSHLDEIVANVLMLEEYALSIQDGNSPRNARIDRMIVNLSAIVAKTNVVEMAQELAAFAVDNKIVSINLADNHLPRRAAPPARDVGGAPRPPKAADSWSGKYERPPLFVEDQMRQKAKDLLATRKLVVDEKVTEKKKTITSLEKDLEAVQAKLAVDGGGVDAEALSKKKLTIQSQIESVKYVISTLQRRKTLSIDKSDFFSSQELKRLRDDGNKGQILITAQDFHLASVPAEAGKEGKRAQVHGALADVFKVDAKDGRAANFQPYFANFGGVHFKEEPNDGKPKTRIFGEAEMFMANFSRGDNGFGKGCTFENIDFTMMGGSKEAALKIFATMQIENCVFIGCDFPAGVKFDKDAGEIVLPKGLKEAANDLRAAFSRINAMDDKNESEKNKMMEGVWQEFKDLPKHDNAFHANVSKDDKWAAILKRVAPPSAAAVKPISYKCLVIERAPVEIVL